MKMVSIKITQCQMLQVNTLEAMFLRGNYALLCKPTALYRGRLKMSTSCAAYNTVHVQYTR